MDVLLEKKLTNLLQRVVGANFFLILLFSLSTLFVSCDKSSVIGNDIQPTNSLIQVDFIDTTTLVTKTIQPNSIFTEETDLLYLQDTSMAKVTKVKIEMPYLMNWANANAGNLGINIAELVIKIDTAATYQLGHFILPDTLFLVGINDDGSTFGVPDYYEGPNYFGGFYNYDTNEYRFNLVRYTQQLVSGKIKNNGMYLTAGVTDSNKVIIGGGESGSPYRMKLNIACTKVPK